MVSAGKPRAKRGHRWKRRAKAPAWWHCLLCHAQFHAGEVRMLDTYYRERWGRLVSQHSEPPCRSKP